MKKTRCWGEKKKQDREEDEGEGEKDFDLFQTNLRLYVIYSTTFFSFKYVFRKLLRPWNIQGIVYN